MNKKGQGVLIFCLILSAIVVALISSIMISYNNLNSQVKNFRTKILGYQATVQIAQVIQQGYTSAVKFPSCLDASIPGQTLMTVNGKGLCLPSSICVSNQFKYCVAKGPGFLITKTDSQNESENMVAESSFWKRLSVSLFSEAQAQSMNRSWMPTLSSPPTVAIGTLDCTATNTCAICDPAANGNSACFKIRICTNGVDSCPNKRDYFETLIAIVYEKI